MLTNDFYRYAAAEHGLTRVWLEQYAQRTTAPLRGAISPVVIEERPLNVAQLDVFSRLMMDRIIFLGVPIDDYVANVVQAQLLFLSSADNQRPINLYINSPGGSVTAGLGIYDTMRHVGPAVSTLCTSVAASMSAVLLAAGTAGRRSALPHARIMIHQTSGGSQGKLADMEITYRLYKELQDELYQILSDHTGQSLERIAQDCDRDHWMRAPEAQTYGIIDEVATP